MIPLSAYEAATDARLTPHQVRVYLLLHRHLNYTDFRPVKGLWIASLAKMNEHAALRLLRELTAAGYLQRGEPSGSRGRQVNTYRLALPVLEGEPARHP